MIKRLWNQPVVRVGLMSAIFAIFATTLVAYIEQSTRPQITENERQALLEALNVYCLKLLRKRFDLRLIELSLL